MFFGVALNGVPFDPGNKEGADDQTGTVNKDGSYVYKGLPKIFITQPLSHVGYAADGFPIFVSETKKYTPSYKLNESTNTYEFAPNHGNLDACNGVTVNNKYYIYILTEGFPFTPRCWSGAPDQSFAKAGAATPPEEKETESRNSGNNSRALPGTRRLSR